MAKDTETETASDTSDDAQTPAPNGADPALAADPAAADPDADQAGRTRSLQRALGVKFAAAAFGEIVNVLMHAPSYRHYALAELEWLVVPAVVANQFSLAGARTDVAGLTVPVAVALWAKSPGRPTPGCPPTPRSRSGSRRRNGPVAISGG